LCDCTDPWVTARVRTGCTKAPTADEDEDEDEDELKDVELQEDAAIEAETEKDDALTTNEVEVD